MVQKKNDKKLSYPHTKREEVFDQYHGNSIHDPYRWLEKPEDPQTREWLAQQIELTESFLSEGSNYKQRSIKRLMELWDYDRIAQFRKTEAGFFYLRNSGIQDQPILYRADVIGGEEEVILDPHTLSSDNTVALSDYSVSPNGFFLAYSLVTHGSDWQKIYILDLESNVLFEEVIERTRFGLVAWSPDSTSFFYTCYPESELGQRDAGTKFNQIYLHRLGTPQEADQLIYKDDENKYLGYMVRSSDDGEFLFISVHQGTDTDNRLYYMKLNEKDCITKLIEEPDANYMFVNSCEGALFIQTNKNAPNGRLIAVNPEKPAEEYWREIIPQQENQILQYAAIIHKHIVAVYAYQAKNIMKIFTIDGSLVREPEMKGYGTIINIVGRMADDEFYYSYNSFTSPTRIFRYSFDEQVSRIAWTSRSNIDDDDFDVSQVQFSSADGTKIPLYLFHRKDLVRNSANKTILYGYGGFNISMFPSFSPSILHWVEEGGIFALANLRGGGEFGEEWHKAGMLHNKQNVFDDFIAAGEWLVKENYTSNENLVIEGGSNGGLLVAACMVQRPDLFGAVICEVPVLDMLRYHKFTVGRYWVGEYGNAEENEEHFNFMIKYSPLHNVRKDGRYPATLIVTADTDDRVVPAHAFKFAATLQTVDNPEKPVLLRVENRAGHGHGKPVSKIVEEYADIFTFLDLVLP